MDEEIYISLMYDDPDSCDSAEAGAYIRITALEKTTNEYIGYPRQMDLIVGSLHELCDYLEI